jgi:hypothetical protein
LSPGLFEERTELAWSRSGISVLVLVAVLVRRLWPLGDAGTFAVLMVTGVGSGIWAAGMALARRDRWRPATPGTAPPGTASPDRASPGAVGTRACRLLAVGTVVLAAAGLVLALFTPS